MNARGAALVLTLLVACGGSSPAPQTKATEAPGTSKPTAKAYAAPDFTVTTFEGEKFRLGVHKGTPVVLNFWESW